MFEKAWSFPIHRAPGAFLVDGNSCFVASRSSRLVALSTDSGETRWSAPVANPYGWLACNDSAVFYLNQHSHLQAHDRATGHPLWSRELSGMNGWLHGCGNRVIVGGWRGYTDIVALDAADGRLCWSRGARSAGLHSTRVHAGSKTLVVADPRNEQVVGLRLDDGHESFARPTRGWSDGFVEHPTGSVAPDAPAVVRVGSHEFLLIKSDTREIQSIVVEPDIWSQELSCTGSVVPFLTSTNELRAWHVAENRLLSLGALSHNRSDILPFCQVTEQAFVVGTSFGELRHVSAGGSILARQKIGKRVSTRITLVSGLIVCGTDSGEVIGVRILEDG